MHDCDHVLHLDKLCHYALLLLITNFFHRALRETLFQAQSSLTSPAANPRRRDEESRKGPLLFPLAFSRGGPTHPKHLYPPWHRVNT